MMPYIKKIYLEEIVQELCDLMKELRMDNQADQKAYYMRRINIVLNVLDVHSWDDEVEEICND